MENQNQNWQDLMAVEPNQEVKVGEPSAQPTEVGAEAVADTVALPAAKLEVALKIIDKLETELKEVKELLSAAIPTEAGRLRFTAPAVAKDGNGKIIEGVFDGEKMIGSDGEIYSVPANYASKSKLVEGDIMKLTITGNGMFIFKQISPIERQRVTGLLAQDEDDNFWVETEGKHWRVLTASVTYFKGEPGDEATILVPKGAPSRWAAVEHIVKKRPLISQ